MQNSLIICNFISHSADAVRDHLLAEARESHRIHHNLFIGSEKMIGGRKLEELRKPKERLMLTQERKDGFRLPSSTQKLAKPSSNSKQLREGELLENDQRDEPFLSLDSDHRHKGKSSRVKERIMNHFCSG